jgi:DNA-binding transcriptional LysR family regulator
LTYSPGFTGRSNIEKAFKNAGQRLDITLSAADSDIIKTYVRLGLGVGIIASMSYEVSVDSDLHVIIISLTRLNLNYFNYLFQSNKRTSFHILILLRQIT